MRMLIDTIVVWRSKVHLNPFGKICQIYERAHDHAASLVPRPHLQGGWGRDYHAAS